MDVSLPRTAPPAGLWRETVKRCKNRSSKQNQIILRQPKKNCSLETVKAGKCRHAFLFKLFNYISISSNGYQTYKISDTNLIIFIDTIIYNVDWYCGSSLWGKKANIIRRYMDICMTKNIIIGVQHAIEIIQEALIYDDHFIYDMFDFL